MLSPPQSSQTLPIPYSLLYTPYSPQAALLPVFAGILYQFVYPALHQPRHAHRQQLADSPPLSRRPSFSALGLGLGEGEGAKAGSMFGPQGAPGFPLPSTVLQLLTGTPPAAEASGKGSQRPLSYQGEPHFPGKGHRLTASFSAASDEKAATPPAPARKKPSSQKIQLRKSKSSSTDAGAGAGTGSATAGNTTSSSSISSSASPVTSSSLSASPSPHEASQAREGKMGTRPDGGPSASTGTTRLSPHGLRKLANGTDGDDTKNTGGPAVARRRL
jgi:hypothetical protein